MTISVKGSRGLYTVLGVLIVCALTAELYFAMRGQVAGLTPYGTVNQLWEQEKLTFSAEQNVYPNSVDTVALTLHNGGSDYAVVPEGARLTDWVLEVEQYGGWHTLRTTKKNPKWSFPAEEYGPDSGPSGVVTWDGGEQTFLCEISSYYKTPLTAGRYRIVFPDMAHRNTGHLAAEFEVR